MVVFSNLPAAASARRSGEGKPTVGEGLDYFWRYAAERQQIYLRRQAGEAAPWTDDTVLVKHRFTNVYRAADRVSQYLINKIQYDQDWNWKDTFARTLLFKVFNRPRTWEFLVGRFGKIDSRLIEGNRIDQALAEIAGRQPLYNPAYVMPPPRQYKGPKFERHLNLLRQMLKDGAYLKIQAAGSLKEAFEILRSYPSMGDFLAYQFVIDLNYSRHLSFSESEFVVAGPGARRGLRKCFIQSGSLTDSQLIVWTAERQQEEFIRRDLSWQNLGGRALQLIDIQNIFCELDKYTRLARPELARLAPGKRIKQLYRPVLEPLTANFPPKWRLHVVQPNRRLVADG